MWPYIGMLSYHLYATPYDPYRANIRDFGNARGIRRAQTEFTGQTAEILYDDLTQAEVSVWELYYWGTTYLSLTDFWYGRKGQFWNVRQITRYVRPGSVRVDAAATGTALRPLAFMRGGKPTVVLYNTTGGAATTVDVAGLVPGSYGLCGSRLGVYTEMGVATAGADGVLRGVAIPDASILTVYPYTGNRAPTIVDWKASSQFLAQPASGLTLSAAAQDPELDPVTYAWSVLSAPAGAAVALATPNAASCAASGMTAAGDYVFQVRIGDPTHALLRTLEVTVFAGDQAPVINDLHNRIPVDLTLPTDTSTTLRGGATDVEGDALTYLWTVASAPAGSAVVLATPTATSCVASGMTVAGNYVFQLTASDRTHTVTRQHTVPVYPVNVAPSVTAIAASPAVLTLPASGTILSATTSDPDAAAIAPWRGGNDVLTHWWEVQSAPAGTKPVFATPGRTTTAVSGLTVAGTYTFKLTAFDRSLSASRTVTVTVNPGQTPVLLPEIELSRSGAIIGDGGTDAVAGAVAGTAVQLDYQIANRGTGPLALAQPALGALLNCTATVVSAPPASLAAGGSAMLKLTVTPLAAGAWSCAVSIANDDGDENPANWSINGIATAPILVPAPWTLQDLGATGATGSATCDQSTGIWTISGAGTGIAGTADACTQVVQMVGGDFDLTANLPFLPSSAATAQAVLFLREKPTVDARVACVGLLGSRQVVWAQRKEAGAISQTLRSVASAPWLRLSRRGNLVSGWYSLDGTTWQSAGTAITMAIPDQVPVGLAVASGTGGQLMTAQFQSVSLIRAGTAAPTTININFQPSTSPILVLSGTTWLPADGSVFGQRWGGLAYGCDGATTATVNRNSTLSADERYDTGLNPSLLSRTFSVAVPDGAYQVTVCVGDASASSGVLAPEVQGMRVVTGTATSATRWFTGTVQVEVVGGRLVLSCGAGSTASRWAWMTIVPIASSG